MDQRNYFLFHLQSPRISMYMFFFVAHTHTGIDAHTGIHTLPRACFILGTFTCLVFYTCSFLVPCEIIGVIGEVSYLGDAPRHFLWRC